MQEKLQCYMCDRIDNRGIVIYNQYVCRNCELQLIKINLDELKYEFFKRKLKKMWKYTLV
jgi:hypothetical protein